MTEGNFVDYVKLFVSSGDGGKGSNHLHREKYIDKGGPDGDMVLMEPVDSINSIRNGDIVSAMVLGSGTTLKYFLKKNNKIILEAANPNYEPIILDYDNVSIQGKLLAVWRKV